MVALNVGSMPGPAPPQFPGHSLPSSSLKGCGPRSQEAHPWLRPLVWSPCAFCDQNRAWTTSAWAGDSVGQRGQHGTEGIAWDRGMCPRRPRLWQSHSTDPLCMSLQPLGKERSGEGREKHGAVCRALDEKAPLVLVFSAASLLCHLLSVPVLSSWPSSFASFGHF